ncbi:xylulokinase [Ferruginivarius sediminum]|uniref:Carbohydrate kinase n=1 Tax=Ferruginivarius sediminum TaxID=2661937 RepID=A0A369TBK1_9PROT|nr:FGGY-family carbohydrate kinase [Ferruginivarius sediminum]RDD61894.1 hypothetical protein DRB17_10405 [Ferruginivarius sediminum]
MAESLFIGVDLGTSALKCGLWDTAGTCHGAARVAYTTETHDGRAEQRAGDWWAALCTAVGESCEGAARARIAAIAVGGHAPSPVFVDDALTPVGPVLTWRDSRAAEDVAHVFADLGGRPADGPTRLAAQVAARARWMRREVPEAYARAAVALHSWEYLIARLSGEAPCERGAPSGLPVALGVAERLLAGSGPAAGTIAGTVMPDVAARLGVPAGTAVVAAGLDSYLGAVGSGISAPGDACLTAGSSSVVASLLEPPAEGRFRLAGLPMASVPVGATGTLLRAALALSKDPVALQIARAVELSAPSVDLEALDPVDPGAPARVAELGRRIGPEAALRAVLEAIMTAERRVLAEIGGPLTRLRLVGGQAASPALTRFRAERLPCQIEVPARHDSGALGAAMLAAVALGAVSDHAEAARRMVHPSRAYAPSGKPGASSSANNGSDSSSRIQIDSK